MTIRLQLALQPTYVVLLNNNKDYTGKYAPNVDLFSIAEWQNLPRISILTPILGWLRESCPNASVFFRESIDRTFVDIVEILITDESEKILYLLRWDVDHSWIKDKDVTGRR